MSSYGGRREFRAGKGLIMGTAVSALIFAVGAVVTYRLQGWIWLSIVLTCCSVFGLAGSIESFALRVRLSEDAMHVTDYRGQRRYPIDDIARVEEAKAYPPPYCSKTDAG